MACTERMPTGPRNPQLSVSFWGYVVMNNLNLCIRIATMAAFLAAAAPALAGDAPKEPAPPMASGLSHELTQALLHANYAATATSVEDLHQHLHHVINCIVGPEGSGFDNNFMNPCHGMGNGALPDASSDAEKKHLNEVLEHAKAALRTDDFVLAKDAARIAVWTLMTGI